MITETTSFHVLMTLFALYQWKNHYSGDNVHTSHNAPGVVFRDE